MSKLIDRYQSHGLNIRIYMDCFCIELTEYPRFWDAERYGQLSAGGQKKWERLKTLEGVKQTVEEILDAADCNPDLWRDPHGINDRFDCLVPEDEILF